MSVTAHLMAPGSRGLFSGAVIESGPSIGVLGVDPYAANSMDQALALGQATARRAGCPPGPGCVECMRSVDIEVLLRSMPEWENDRTGLSLTVDGEVLPSPPLELFKQGRLNPIRGMIIGINRDEAFQATRRLPRRLTLIELACQAIHLPRNVTSATVLQETAKMLRPYLMGSPPSVAAEVAERALELYPVRNASGNEFRGEAGFATPWEAFDALATDFQVGCLSRETITIIITITTYEYM